MNKIDRIKFFDGFRIFLFKQKIVLSARRVAAINILLAAFEAISIWKDLRHVAYALATVCIETGWTFEPIQEYGTYAYFERRYGYKTKKGKDLGNDAIGEGAKYSGKGDVQLTGETNYEVMEEKLRKEYPQLIADFEARTGEKFDLTDFPNQAKDPQIAFAIMTIGMFEGLFTGKKFSDYITDDKCNYKGARRIINGQDRAAEIAGYALEIEQLLKVSSANMPIENVSSGSASTSTDSTIQTTFVEDQAVNPSPQSPENPPVTSITFKEFCDKYLRHCPQDKLKNILWIVAGRIFAPVSTLWALGLHTKILIVIFALLAVFVLGRAIYKYRTRLLGWIKDLIDSFLGNE